MYGVLVAMVLAGAVEAEEPIEVLRFHGEASVLGSAGISGIPSIGIGPGVHLEVGAVVAESLVLSLRASFATVGIFSVMQFGASYAHLVTDRVSLGIGLTWGGLLGCCDASSSLSIQTPVRVTLRVGDAVRRGLTFGFEVAPGIVYRGGGFFTGAPTLPNISVIAALTAGYAVW